MKGVQKIISIAIMLVLAISMPLAAINGVFAAPVGTIAYGSPSGSSLAIGSTFTVAVQISGASNVWQFALDNIAYDPAVINYTGATEGTYLNSLSGGTIFLAPPAATTPGLVSEISDTRLPLNAPSATSGLLCTLSFQVIGYGNSGVSMGSAKIVDPSQVALTLTVANTQYTGLPPPTPYGPTAIISSPINNAFVLQGTPIALDGSASTGGFVNPNFLPITSYAWTINGAGIVNLQLNGATPGSVTPTIAGDLSVSLTVTATGATPPTSTQAVTVHVYAPATGLAIDLYTQNGGAGPNAPSDAFGPQQNVLLYANVTYNGAPVAQKDVAFQINDKNGNLVDVRTARTDANGQAVSSYRLPWPDVNPDNTFGTWTINATVSVSQQTAVDNTSFTFNYLLKTTAVATLVYPSNAPASSFARAGSTSTGQMEVQISVRNIASLTAYTGRVVITLSDEANVPVAVITETITVPAGATHTDAQTLTIPHYAFVGQAKAYVDVLTNLPSVGGVPYCPEAATPFSITQ